MFLQWHSEVHGIVIERGNDWIDLRLRDFKEAIEELEATWQLGMGLRGKEYKGQED